MDEPTQNWVAFSTTPAEPIHAASPADNAPSMTPFRWIFDPQSPPTGFHESFVCIDPRPPHRFTGRYSWPASCTDWGRSPWQMPRMSGFGSPGSGIALAGLADARNIPNATMRNTTRARSRTKTFTPCPHAASERIQRQNRCTSSVHRTHGRST